MEKKRILKKIGFAFSLLIVFIFAFSCMSIFISAAPVEFHSYQLSDSYETCNDVCSANNNAICVSTGSTSSTNDFKMIRHWFWGEVGCFSGIIYRTSCSTSPLISECSPSNTIWCKCAEIDLPANACVKTYSGTSYEQCPAGYETACGGESRSRSGAAFQCKIPDGETWIPSNNINQLGSVGWKDAGSWVDILAYHHGETKYCTPYNSGFPWALHNLGARAWSFKTYKICGEGKKCQNGDCVSAAVNSPVKCEDVIPPSSTGLYLQCTNQKDFTCLNCLSQADWTSFCKNKGYTNACSYSSLNYCYSFKDGDSCNKDNDNTKNGKCNKNNGECDISAQPPPENHDCDSCAGYTDCVGPYGSATYCGKENTLAGKNGKSSCSVWDDKRFLCNANDKKWYECSEGSWSFATAATSGQQYGSYCCHSSLGWVESGCDDIKLIENCNIIDSECVNRSDFNYVVQGSCTTDPVLNQNPAYWNNYCKTNSFGDYACCDDTANEAYCYVYNNGRNCTTFDNKPGTCSSGKCVSNSGVCDPGTTCCDINGQYAPAGTSCTTSNGKSGTCSGSSAVCTCTPTKTSCTVSDCGPVDNGCGATLTCCCPDGSSCSDSSICCSPYCADTTFTGSKICKSCSLNTDQWCDGKMAGCDQGMHYTDPDSSSYLCQSCDNSNPERYWFTDTGCCGDDDNEYFNDGASGACWNKNRTANTNLVSGYNEVTVEGGIFHGCAINHESAANSNPEADSSRTNKKPYKDNDWMLSLKDDPTGLGTGGNLITDHTYCDNISSGDNEKFCSYAEEWVETRGKERTHLSYINWSDQINWTTTTIQEAECCEPTQCWNGSNCVNNQAATQEIYTYPGTNLRCIDGDWEESPLKSTWDDLAEGYCPSVEQCLVTPKGSYDNNNNPLMFNYNYLDNPTSSSNSGSPQCIDDSQYIGDHYCENGEWTTRTKLLALQLLDVADKSSDPTNYNLFCDDYANVLNYYDYTLSIGASINYIYEYFIKQTNGCKIYPESAPEGIAVPCTNKVCVLSYKKNRADSVVVGVSLNQPINSTKYAFLDALSKPSNYCENTFNNDDVFYSCTNNDLWYNDNLQLAVYSKDGVTLEGISFWDKFALFLKNPFESIFKTVINVIKPSSNEGNTLSYEFINKTSNFDRIYLNQKGESKSIKGVTEKIGNEEFLLVTYNGFSADICESVDSYLTNSQVTGEVISCNQTGDLTYYVETIYESRLNSWHDLTSKLRIQ